jgi:serine/threonine-protein kinase
VVNVFDVGEHEGSPYVAMELVLGKSLRAMIGDAEVSLAEKLRVLAEVARALGAAHDAQIIHRDVKPENVIVTPSGGVKVLDFGIARRSSVKSDPSAPTEASLSTLTAEGVKLGTPMYMAPEQIKGGALDGRADQFAWGVTAYELLAGRAPWSGDAMSVIASVMSDEPAPLPGNLPPAVAAVVLRALAKKPEGRFSSMKELEDALTVALPPRTSAPPRKSAPPRDSAALRESTPASAPPAPSVVAAGWSHPPPSPAPLLSRRYTAVEAANLLDRALAAQRRRFDHDEVVEGARRVGFEEVVIDHSMFELVRRGVIEPSDSYRRRQLMPVKRQGAIFGVIAAFFFLLNLGTWGGELWFQVPVVCIGLVFGLAIVRQLFPKAAPRQLHATRDPAFEYDVQQLARWMGMQPPPARSAPSLPPSAPPREVRIAERPAEARVPPRPPTTLEQAEAELEEYLASKPEAIDESQRR